MFLYDIACQQELNSWRGYVLYRNASAFGNKDEVLEH